MSKPADQPFPEEPAELKVMRILDELRAAARKDALHEAATMLRGKAATLNDPVMKSELGRMTVATMHDAATLVDAIAVEPKPPKTEEEKPERCIWPAEWGLLLSSESCTHPDEPNHDFCVVRFSAKQRLCVASINGPVGEWRGYTGMSSNWWVIRQFGDKLDEKTAAQVFPEIARRFAYAR